MVRRYRFRGIDVVTVTGTVVADGGAGDRPSAGAMGAWETNSVRVFTIVCKYCFSNDEGGVLSSSYMNGGSSQISLDNGKKFTIDARLMTCFI